MDNSILRNMKFISSVVMRTMLMVLAILAVYAVMGVLGGMNIDFMTPGFVFEVVKYTAAFVVMVIEVTIATAYQKLILSLGSRRRDFYIAKYILLLIVFGVTMAILGCMTYAYDSVKVIDFMYAVAALLAICVFTIFCANMICRFGMVGYVIFCACCGFIGGLIGGLTGVGMKYKILQEEMFPGILIGVAFVAVIIAMIVDKKMLDSYEIK